MVDTSCSALGTAHGRLPQPRECSATRTAERMEYTIGYDKPTHASIGDLNINLGRRKEKEILLAGMAASVPARSLMKPRSVAHTKARNVVIH